MHVLNTEFFGYIMEDEKYKDTNVASRDFFQFKLDTLGELGLTMISIVIFMATDHIRGI